VYEPLREANLIRLRLAGAPNPLIRAASNPPTYVSYMSNVIVWDIETVPDLRGFAAANGHVGKSDDEVRAELGDKFPKHIYHSIICIGVRVR
jgi:hypothetical protein